MCGIAGSFAFRDSAAAPDERNLLAVREALHSRGPDGAGLWQSEDRRVAFAHRRLAIIDLEDRALQPMHWHDGSLTIIFNGEIYNFRALREELERERGIRFRTESDTEVLLALFAIHGAGMIHRLRGMFALAIWDNVRRRLFLARDPYGIKPLYYAEGGGLLHFASQVKALLKHPAISRQSDPAGLVGFQLMGSVPEPFTLYRAIRALPAGHFMWIDRDGVGSPQRYAHVAERLAAATPDDASPIGAVVADAALDSVRAHLVADVEVGVFLSSGIDSGSLVGLMRDAGQQRIRAFTLGFEELAGTPADEVPLARTVARHYGAEHHVELVTRASFDDDADRILDAMDQPSIDGINSWFVSKTAHNGGLKVVLSGLGGDELLAGYSTFETVPRMRRLGRWTTRLPFAGRFARTLIGRFAPDWARRNSKTLGVLDYAGSWEGSYLLRRATMLPFDLDRGLDRDTVREGLDRLAPLDLIGRAMIPDPGEDRRRVCALESSLYMRNQLLRDADWASMAHSLELRVPFVDWPTLGRIAPITHRLGDRAGKLALANAPSAPLPAEVMNRGRTGFTVPVGKWIGAGQTISSGLASRQWSGRVSAAFTGA